MDTLFELLNLSPQCETQSIGIPVYTTDREGCSKRDIQLPTNTCALLQACIDNTILFPYFSSPSAGINMAISGDLISIDIDSTRLNTNVNSTWIAPILTIGNHQINLSSLLLASNVYWQISDPLQQLEGRPLYIIDNRRTLQIAPIDGMRHFFDVDGASPTFHNWVVGLPLEFITTPLGAPSQYDYNYWSNPGLTPYNPRRYVLTRYETFSVDGVNRNCGRAVWAEPQCCMQTLILDGCMLGLGGGNGCNGRCQTIRDQINGTEWVSLCNIFNQQITIEDNEICYYLPGATQADDPIEVCVDISELNNHHLLTYPGSEVNNYILELYNSNNILQTSVDLGFMFDQQLVYNTIPVTPQPAHPVAATINNTLCITQPLGAPNQCIDLNRVNNQEIHLDGWNLVINSVLNPMNDCDNDCSGRVLSLYEYLNSWNCSEACNCVMDSVPDWYSLIAEPATGRPAGREDFLDSNPNVFEMMTWLVEHIQNVYNKTAAPGTQILSLGYERPCNLDLNLIDPNIDPPTCEAPYCCAPCGGGGLTINEIYITVNQGDNIWITLGDVKYHAKRWLATDWTVSQPFNGTLDADGDVCNPLNNNVGRYLSGNVFSNSYGWNPTSMPSSCMTDTIALNAASRIHIPRRGDYLVYFDGPIEVNHMVHGFRIALILHRDGNDIMVGDRKMSGDPHSASGSVNNGYYKETKQYYVHLMKTIELLRDDELSLQVKIDANVSRPRDNLDPITLGDPTVTSSLWTEHTPGAVNPGGTETKDDRIFQGTGAAPGWSIPTAWNVENSGVRLEYGGPATTAFSQNFNALAATSPTIYHRLNGFVRAGEQSIVVPAQSHSGCFSVNCNDHPSYTGLTHSHSVVSRFPAIAPQAPKYIHFTDENNASWNYPGRNSSALINPQSGKTEAYSHTGIDANGIVTLLTRAGLDESGCSLDSHYTHIDDQSGFSFGVKRIGGLWPDQVPVYL